MKTRIYQIDPDCVCDPVRSAVFEAVGRRFTEILSPDKVTLDWQQFAAEQVVEGSPSSILITNSAAGDPSIDQASVEDLADLLDQCDKETISGVYRSPRITQPLWQAAEQLLDSEKRQQICNWIWQLFEIQPPNDGNAAFAAPA